MSRKTIIVLLFIFGAAVAAFLILALAPQAQAQQGCMEFRALGHGILPTPHPLSETDTWGADFWGTLGGQFVSGYVSGNDGDAFEHGVTTIGRNGSYTYVFVDADNNVTGTLVVEIPHAAWPFPPGKAGLGYYRGAGKIVKGTGRFQNASGQIEWAGPFIVWPADTIFGVAGRFNPEIRGNIFGVQ